MAIGWRFFMHEDRRWYWERMLPAGVSRSSQGFASYEECVKAAIVSGYEFQPSQAPGSRAMTLDRRSNGAAERRVKENER